MYTGRTTDPSANGNHFFPVAFGLEGRSGFHTVITDIEHTYANDTDVGRKTWRNMVRGLTSGTTILEQWGVDRDILAVMGRE